MRQASFLWIMPISAVFISAVPVSGQTRGKQDVDTTSTLTPGGETETGRTASVGSGEVGRRQSRTEVAPNIAPLGRIESRIANRVQSRIRNRIDRNYDPSANAASPFEVAGDKARKTPRGPR